MYLMNLKIIPFFNLNRSNYTYFACGTFYFQTKSSTTAASDLTVQYDISRKTVFQVKDKSAFRGCLDDNGIVHLDFLLTKGSCKKTFFCLVARVAWPGH